MFGPRVGAASVRMVVGAQVVAVSLLVAAVSGWSHAHLAAATVALAAGAGAARLGRLAYECHTARRPQRGAGPMALGLMAIGMSLIALAGAALAMGLAAGLDADILAKICIAGLGLAVAAFLPALLILAGAERGLSSRARQLLDGLGVGILLLYSVWVLVICPHGRLDSLPVWIAILSCCTLSMAAVTALQAGRGRPVALAWAASVALVVVGQIGLAACLTWPHLIGYALLPGAVLVVAAALAWWGASRQDTVDSAEQASAGPLLARLPVLAGPAAFAFAVTLHSLAFDRPFGPVAVTLGLVGVALVVVRESLAARDVGRYARRLAEQNARFSSLVAGSNDVIMVLDRDLVVRWQSPASTRLFALLDHEVVGRHFQSMLHPEDAIAVGERLAAVRARDGGARPVLIEARLRDGFGRWRDTESSVTNQLDVPSVGGIVVHIRDISERTEMKRRLRALGSVDQLTGLPNRAEVLTAIGDLQQTGRPRGCLLLIKLEGFTAVNDVRGYDVGDAVLVEVADRLRSAIADSDLPARVSGDEFAVITRANAVQAYALAERLVTVLSVPIALPGGTVHLSASIGMDDVAAGEDVLRRVDLALRRARQLGRGRVEWYDAAVEEKVLRRMRLEQDLPEALARGEMDVVYQPILDISTQRPVAVEALLRWRHPDLGILMPGEVIPIAEDLGIIDEIGGWVLDQAARQLASWRRDGRDVALAVNVSPHRLTTSRVSEDLTAALERYDLPADRLIVEVSEARLGSDSGLLHDMLVRIRSLGVRTTLDDFGTGIESLTHLRALPLDMVKVGRGFFDDTAGRPGGSVPIIDVLVGLGRRLGIEVVALGLETPEHLEVVQAAGCRYGQGHLFVRPQPAERIEAYLHDLRLASAGVPPRNPLADG